MAYFDREQLVEAMSDVAPAVSDLNLSVGASPQVEVDGSLKSAPFAGLERSLPYHTELIAMRLVNDKLELAQAADRHRLRRSFLLSERISRPVTGTRLLSLSPPPPISSCIHQGSTMSPLWDFAVSRTV